MKESTHTYVRREFTDADDLTAAGKIWDIEFARIDKGPFQGLMEQYIGPDIVLSRASSSAKLRQRGQPPVGMRTFVLPLNSEMEMVWRGHHVDGNSLLLFPVSGELEAATAPGFDVLTISMAPDMLVRACLEVTGRSCDDVNKGKEIYPLPPSLMSGLRLRFHRLLWSASGPSPVQSADTWGAICHLVEAVVWEQTSLTNSSSATRAGIVARAERYVQERAGDAPTVGELCRHVGVGERSLQYAFGENLGVSPKTYILATRLNGVRRALKKYPSESRKISDVANAWGFWHMGQFAADYRKMFAELPSETVKRSTSNTEP